MMIWASVCSIKRFGFQKVLFCISLVL
ncbi:hypothetical protein OIU76_015640 [Salix suchowensis]|uniref:Uncharacterized protein n=1 Tax=Salix udensis TaxID=889485 RepID=A0AAD6NYG7_9ROSI|nr:hypothetical protein OIU76_015640 [Salix suchowensis]KAJ6410022.1 hypothetical protein OIU84_009505 [Salix udensis]